MGMGYCCICGREANQEKSFHCTVDNDVYHYCNHHSYIGKALMRIGNNKKYSKESNTNKYIGMINMKLDEAINRLSNCTPITKEDKEAFECAVECMKFTKDFYSLEVTPERAKHALNLLNALEYAVNIHFAR